jgi:hypothetical protein
MATGNKLMALLLFACPLSAGAVVLDVESTGVADCPRDQFSLTGYKFTKNCGGQYRFTLTGKGQCFNNTPTDRPPDIGTYQLSGKYNEATGKAGEWITFLIWGNFYYTSALAKCTGNPWMNPDAQCQLTDISGAEVLNWWALDPSNFPLSRKGINDQKRIEFQQALKDSKVVASIKVQTPAEDAAYVSAGWSAPASVPVKVTYTPDELVVETQISVWKPDSESWKEIPVQLGNQHSWNGVLAGTFRSGVSGTWQLHFTGECPGSDLRVASASRVITVYDWSGLPSGWGMSPWGAYPVWPWGPPEAPSGLDVK